MRLLQLGSASELSLTDDLIEDIPRYAILSHTWRIDGDEVTFEDLQFPSAKSKAGYDKIRFCGEQAKKDGLQYFWVDTCCINKSSSAELQEAIRSMFEWYRKAVKCYVYLQDVSISDQDEDKTTQSAFQKSRWFKRGWTLQELLAPRVVEFYSREGQLLGDKMSLEQQIHETTDIPVNALRGAPLRGFSHDERLRWAAKRETKRKEDMAYCLVGILGVFMYFDYGEGDNAFERLKEEIGKISRHNTSKPVYHVPFNKMSGFVGRSDELNAVKKGMFDRDDISIISLHGLGGVGKSRLALELAYWVKSEYSQHSVFWVQADKLLTFEEDMLQIGRKLGVAGIDDAGADIKILMKQRLQDQSDEKWFLVLDNADDEALWGRRSDPSRQEISLVDYLPRSPNGTILVTTRSRRVATFLSGEVIDLQALSRDEAAEMFMNRTRSLHLTKDRTAIEMLAEKLTNLPLAVVQASSFINETQCSVQTYIELLDEPEDDVVELLSKDFGDQLRYSNARNPIATTWLISFQHIQKYHPLASAFLSSMACLHEKAIPLSLLPEASSKLKVKVVEAIGVLIGYSFIQKRAVRDGILDVEQLYDMHRLVQLAARSWLKMEDKLLHEIRNCTIRLAELFPERDHQDKNIWSLYLPHGQRLCDGGGDFAERYYLFEKMGLWFAYDGKYDEAVQAHTMVVDWREKEFGISDEHTLEAYNNLGEALDLKGNWALAEKYLRCASDGRKRSFGAEDSDTLTSMSNLALTLFNQGRLTQAEELQVQVTEIRKRVFGAEHPSTLTSMSNLASTLWKQGRITEAEELQVRVIETRKRVLGAEHPDTLTSMSNLALTLYDQGRLREAEELGTQVIETRKRVLGAEHPSTLNSIANLASTLWKQGRLTEAEELEVQVVETEKRVLGAEHPETLTSMSNLALTLRNQGRLNEAEELQVQVTETGKRVFGAEHPSTLTSMANLAHTYMKQQRRDDAIKLMSLCVDLCMKFLGSSHPETQDTKNWLLEWTRDELDKEEQTEQETGQTSGAAFDQQKV